MKLTAGIEEIYFKEFILDEGGIKEFQKIMENASQRFPAPAEIVYTLGTEDFRYFQTRNFEDVLYDLDVQKKRLVYLSMDTGFVDQNPRLVEENILQEGRSDEWRIRLVFQIVQKGFWESRRDKISLLVSSEERKWAADYIDRFEEQIHKTKRGHQAPNLLFWLFLFPLLILGRSYFLHYQNIRTFMQTNWDYIWFSAAALASFAMTMAGLVTGPFEYKPYGFRFFFGPEAGFLWGEAKAAYEEREQFRQRIFWYMFAAFLAVLLISMNFAMR